MAARTSGTIAKMRRMVASLFVLARGGRLYDFFRHAARRCRAVRSQGQGLHKTGPNPDIPCAQPGIWENRMKLFRPLLAALAVAAVFTMVVADADARPRVSAGSRGSKTFSAPPSTTTAPNAAAPINRTMTQ